MSTFTAGPAFFLNLLWTVRDKSVGLADKSPICKYLYTLLSERFKTSFCSVHIKCIDCPFFNLGEMISSICFKCSPVTEMPCLDSESFFLYSLCAFSASYKYLDSGHLGFFSQLLQTYGGESYLVHISSSNSLQKSLHPPQYLQFLWCIASHEGFLHLPAILQSKRFLHAFLVCMVETSFRLMKTRCFFTSLIMVLAGRDKSTAISANDLPSLSIF